jgi:hypothetical protein
MKGEPSRRLTEVSKTIWFLGQENVANILVEKKLASALAFDDGFFQSCHNIFVGTRPLEESTVSSNGVVDSVLRCSMEL